MKKSASVLNKNKVHKTKLGPGPNPESNDIISILYSFLRISSMVGTRDVKVRRLETPEQSALSGFEDRSEGQTDKVRGSLNLALLRVTLR